MIAKRKSKKQTALFGLTGGIGSGQSTVAGLLRARGAYVVDADEKSRQALDTYPEIKEELRRSFGNRIFMADGTLNRQRLAEIAFSSGFATERLNRIFHPRLVEMIFSEIDTVQNSNKHNLIGVDAAVIYELQLESEFDFIVCVTAPLETRVGRVVKRSGIPAANIRARIYRQLPLEDKAEWADYVIPNEGDEKLLAEQVDYLWELITRRLGS